jgi:uncharacterized protein (TIGR00251 family)
VWAQRGADGWLLHLHVQPGARRTRVVGPHGEALKVQLAAPPVDGRANEALLAHLAERLGLPRREVELRAGASSRRKVVAVPAHADPHRLEP